MKKHQISVTKTARYFTLGTLNEKTTTVWFVLHGYAQTADNFLDSLKSLQQENVFIIAPEGLSRFYWKGFVSNPVASWMTKLEREVDIQDTLQYLDKLYQEIFQKVSLANIKINYLGFSQGVATLSRWISNNSLQVNNVFFYAGDIAHDINIQAVLNFNKANLYFISGTKDVFINKGKLTFLKERFLKANVEIEFFNFEGKHIIHKDALDYIIKNS